jgi:hypothetical protein
MMVEVMELDPSPERVVAWELEVGRDSELVGVVGMTETRQLSVLGATEGTWPGYHEMVPPALVGNLPTFSIVGPSRNTTGTGSVLGHEHGSGEVMVDSRADSLQAIHLFWSQ